MICWRRKTRPNSQVNRGAAGLLLASAVWGSDVDLTNHHPFAGKPGPGVAVRAAAVPVTRRQHSVSHCRASWTAMYWSEGVISLLLRWLYNASLVLVCLWCVPSSIVSNVRGCVGVGWGTWLIAYTNGYEECIEYQIIRYDCVSMCLLIASSLLLLCSSEADHCRFGM